MTSTSQSILYLDTGYKFDIEESYSHKLGLVSQRFSGHVVTFGQVGEFTFGNFTVHSFSILKSKLIMFLRALCYSVLLIRRTRKSGQPIDVLVSYDPLNTGLMGVILSFITGIPLLVEVNGDYTSWTNYAEVSDPRKRAIKRWIYMTVEGFVLRRASGIKLLYPEQLDHFRPTLRSSTVIRTYPNYLDVSVFRNLGESPKAVIVGFPFEVKGIDIAVAAFKKISDKHPDWTLEVLGWYPDAEKKLLDQCIGDHPRVRHHPPISRREMPTYIGSSGVVICASRTEGFPRVIKEAMHAGKPCIVSSVGGLPHAIRHGENGLLFQSENIDELSRNMDAMLSDADLRAKLGEAARQFAEYEYSLQTWLEKFAAFAKEVIASKRRR
jgi:glycosyltransferase involved in cell wall biosynthesis